ncbi:glycosyltransferase [Butyrivibrio fibrisolvens]|uniref:glycosyltransferase n=1 Tax=Butyrivibrio fibrisolvens TaxID=831 RepID=UPI000402A029|nr:glycosyltransferase [Butyrivibrio fibrisolvens]
MKLLVVTYCYEYPNNMYSEYLKTLADVVDVKYWGPGISSKEELLRGLKFEWSSAKYDALLFDFDLVNYILDNNIASIYRYSEQNTREINLVDLYRYTNDIFCESLGISGIKILHVTLDQFYLNENEEKWLNLMLENGFFLEWVGKEFFPNYDKHQVKVCGITPTDQGRQLVEKYYNRVISNPINAISEDEICYSSIEKRQFDWILPGSVQKGIYDNRTRVINRVKQMHVNIYDGFDDRNIRYDKYLDKRTKYMNRYLSEIDIATDGSCPYILRRISRERQQEYRKNFDLGICQSKIAYVDGGNYNSIVHKYFEIPIRGAVLMCGYFWGMENLGFLNDKNMVLVDDNSIIDTISYLLKNPEKMQKIADAGKALVKEKHTYKERCKSLISSIESIINKRFKGSYWKQGNFVIIE